MAPDSAPASHDAESVSASAQPNGHPTSRRTSFNLSPEAEDGIRELARRRGVSMGEVIRRALSMEKFLADRQAEGAKVLIQERDGTLREVVML